ncbi:MAG: hypothetical protein R2748_05920 [Bryobacterales bacterium]
MGSSAIGVLCESHEGRPIKVEGNPDHPASLGATGIFAQAEVLTLWDPTRSKTVLKDGGISSWGALDTHLRESRMRWLRTGGRGLRILTGLNISPTLDGQMDALLAEFPEARWTQYEPVNREELYEGTRIAFGRPLNPIYRFEQADVVVSLDSDFMRFGPGAEAYAKQFALRRSGQGEMNRLYVAEPMPTVTGLMADERLPARFSEIEGLARALAGSPSDGNSWAAAAADDLSSHLGRCLVVAGDRQPPPVHALVHSLNARLGAVGNTVVYTRPTHAPKAANKAISPNSSRKCGRGKSRRW